MSVRQLVSARMQSGAVHEGGSVSEFVTVDLFDPATRQLLGTLTVHAGPDRLTVSFEGFDRPGVLAFLLGLLVAAGVDVEACHGERLKVTQGSYFELTHTPANAARVRALVAALRTSPPPFRPGPLRPFDRVVDLRLSVPQDGTGLLLPLAELLADSGVNIRFFRADRDEFGGPEAGAGEPLPEVRVLARLELPRGLDLGDFRDGLERVSPPHAALTVQTVWKLHNGRGTRSRDYVSN